MQCIKKPLQTYHSARYGVLFYKANGAGAIRRRFGDQKQIFSYGGSSGWFEPQIRALGDEILRQLDGGMSEEDAKTFADEKFK